MAVLRRSLPLKTLLSIAGYDPSSGAGITADLMVFAAHRLFGISCITAMTVQSTLGVRAVHPVQADVLRHTLTCLDEDTPAAGVKIGMLGTAENVSVVCEYLEQLRAENRSVPVVLDPVLRSTSGAQLLDEKGIELLRKRLLALVDWVAPNTVELAILTGREVADASDVPDLCRVLRDQIGPESAGGLGIFAKGGHLEKPDDYILSPTGRGTWLPGERIESRSTHGTGCALSSAFLSRLVLGHDPVAAADLSKDYVSGALRSAVPIGHGSGPINHLWPILKAGHE